MTYRRSSKSSRSRWSGLSTLTLRKTSRKKSQPRILRFRVRALLLREWQGVRAEKTVTNRLLKAAQL